MSVGLEIELWISVYVEGTKCWLNKRGSEGVSVNLKVRGVYAFVKA